MTNPSLEAASPRHTEAKSSSVLYVHNTAVTPRRPTPQAYQMLTIVRVLDALNQIQAMRTN